MEFGYLAPKHPNIPRVLTCVEAVKSLKPKSTVAMAVVAGLLKLICSGQNSMTKTQI